MFKYITFIFIVIFSLTVQAQVVTEHLKVTDSKCTLTAKESNMDLVFKW